MRSSAALAWVVGECAVLYQRTCSTSMLVVAPETCRCTVHTLYAKKVYNNVFKDCMLLCAIHYCAVKHGLTANKPSAQICSSDRHIHVA
jgi:hypothetical protein